MRVSLSAGLTVFAIICLAACHQAAPSSVGANASTSTAPTPAGGSGDTSGGGKYACVMAYEGKTVTCAIYSDFGSDISLAGSKRACASANQQTIAATCPSQDLIGCCTHKDPGSPTNEDCSYKGPLAGTAGPASCAQTAGVWSATP
ncbi:MAG TPA: hypothetical protein VN814_15495 [Caulobacteraceae bacterium]|nr:hypothetical protein [Caulobacteraceae bacterium]